MSTGAYSVRSDRSARRTAPTARVAQLALVAAAAWFGATAPAQADLVWTDDGGASIVQNGGTWTITAANGTIIEFSQFNIVGGQLVQFIQPSDLARVLSRVTSVSPSMIDGTMLANGIVYLVNPAGVLFGNGAIVDVGGLYAAAGNITNADFTAGSDSFSLCGSVIVENGAQLSGHTLHLLGRNVANHGLLESDGGIITMIAGNQVVLQQIGGRIIVHVDGTQLTDRTTPLLGTHAAGMVNTPAVENTGIIRNDGGRIILGAGDLASLAFRNTGTIEAAGGEIDVVAGSGLIQNDGAIDASVANGDAGSVLLQGRSILNRGSIRADTNSGQAGDVTLQSAKHTFITNGSVVSAAGGSGNAAGGNVHIDSVDGYTAIATGAFIDATGGATGGDGGHAFIGGKSLIMNGSAQTAGAAGYAAGELVVDGGQDVDISAAGGNDAFLGAGTISFAVNGDGHGRVRAGGIAGANRSVHVIADRNLNVNAAIDFTQLADLTLSAGNNVKVNDALTNVRHLFLDADSDASNAGFVTVDSSFDVTGDITYGGTDTFLRGGDIGAGGRQDFLGTAWIAVDLALTAQQIMFHKRLESKSLTAILPRLVLNGTSTFNGPVGEELQLRSLVVNGLAFVNGGIVSTTEYQRYFGGVELGDHTHFLSTEGGQIRFADTLDGAYDSLVSTSGQTRFDGRVGGSTALTSLTTDAPGSTRIRRDMTAGRIELNDPVNLAGHAVLTGSQSVSFASTVDGGAFDLTVNSPLTTFGGDATGFRTLLTDAVGLTTIDASLVSANTVSFGDDVQIARNAHVVGVELVNFGGTIDGAYALHIESGKLVRLGGDVGGGTALASLRIDAATDLGAANDLDENLIVMGGALLRAQGNILLNLGGRSGPSHVASIAGLGDLTIESLGGSVEMGLNEKITALGDLRILAGGHALLGDLNALRSIVVDSNDIRFWTRAGGQLLTSGGGLISDGGADVVAGGSIFLSSRPTTVGSGRAPIFVAVGNADGVSETFLFRMLGSIDPASFTLGSLILDLRATLDSDGLAEAIGRNDRGIRDRVLRDPFALRALERLAIDLRGLSRGELVASLAGCVLYRDIPDSGLQGPSVISTSAARLRRESVIRVLDRYSSVFVRSSIDPATGEVVTEDRTAEVKTAIGAAWFDYQAQNTGVSFRTFLETSPNHLEALAHVNGLGDVLREVRTMGTTRREFRRSVDGVLGPVTPDSMRQEELEITLDLDYLVTQRNAGRGSNG